MRYVEGRREKGSRWFGAHLLWRRRPSGGEPGALCLTPVVQARCCPHQKFLQDGVTELQEGGGAARTRIREAEGCADVHLPNRAMGMSADRAELRSPIVGQGGCLLRGQTGRAMSI
jgi:hypothetical protein